MPYHRRYSVKMPEFDDEVTVVDVYDLASDIGKECEIIIEKYGADAVTALLPKVINALELLENLAVRNEKENQALQELTAKISQLENDKIEKAEYRQRFEKEIEAIEEQWRTESADLVTAVSRLQDENKRLRRTINAPGDGTSAPPSPAREHDQEVLSRLSSTAEKQRATLRHQESQLQEKQQLIESLSNQVEKLAQVSRDLRRKHKQIQNQLRQVCEERSELNAIVQSQQRDIVALQQSDAQNKKCTTCGAMSPDFDPHSKPPFSVSELLHERKELKLKLSRAEEQLRAMQAESPPDSSDTSPSVSAAAACDDAPVQGPLPAEPDDAPWKRNSGIRKFRVRKVLAGADDEGRGTTLTATEDLFRPLVLRRTRYGVRGGQFNNQVFANSLLSLTLPWAYSRGARCHPSGRRPPLPAPPPPPRRHSDPTAPAPHKPKTRRYSDINNPKAKLDLRQELINLNLNNQEVDSWLGSKFDEKEEEPYLEKFSHDIPLQRSLSLDGGIEIFNYLQTIGSDWSVESNASSWTVHSYGRDSRTVEQYRSFEDIPASPRAKSRRASFDLDKDNVFFGSGLALSVLKDSYKGFDSTGNISPQIRKLQKNFSFHDSLQDFKTAVNVNDEEKGSDVPKDDEKIESEKQVRQPMYRNISVVQTSSDGDKEVNQSPRQRKIGIPLHRNLSFDGLKKPEVNLRKEILKQTLPDFKSCENLLLQNNPKISRRDSAENVLKSVPLGLTLLKDSYQGIESGGGNISLSIRRLKKNFSFVSPLEAGDGAPTIVMSDVDRRKSDAKNENISRNTSNVVDISRKCDCRICSEEDIIDRRSVWRRIFCKLFMNTVSTNGMDRKAYWDENNNLDEGQMYKCVLHTLKLLFGLWLRHLDHK